MEITLAMGREDIIRCKSHLNKFSNSGILTVFSSKNLVLSGISQMQICYFDTLWTWQPWLGIVSDVSTKYFLQI